MRVMFIDIDTLRKDHMGCYGYYRNTTPNLDKISKEGVRFSNYYTSDAPCLPSRSALISGMFGIRNGAVDHGGTHADQRLYGAGREFTSQVDEGNLHNIFRKAGMRTASISTFPERHSSWWYNAGLNETYNVGGRGGESGEEVLPVAIDWLDRKGKEEDWYLHVHLWDPHTPYRAPQSFGNPFAEEPLESWITEDIVAEHLKVVGPHTINEIGMYDDNISPEYPRQLGRCDNLEDVKRLMDGYDTGILYADYLIGQIIDKTKALGIYEDLAIIISSDHGENMGELGIYSEHATADHPTCNIPMIIKWPGMKQDYKDNQLHYSLDLLPTLCDLLGVEKSANWDGESYSKTVIEGQESGRDELVISQMAHVCQRSARFGDWLYMRTYHDGYHLFDKEMLYNLKEDPYEQQDVKKDYPEICMQGAKIILDWHDEQRMKDTSIDDPLWRIMDEGGPHHAKGRLEEYLERLENTGRKEGAKKLRERHC